MKKFRLTILSILSVLFLSSCIKSEEPNSEADIISCEIVENGVLKTDPIVDNASPGNYTITFMINSKSKVEEITPLFELTEGASIIPESGTPLNLKNPVQYTVTSQDGKWKKKYTVRLITKTMPTKFEFELVETVNNGTNKYHKFYDTIDGELALTWASGNSGFSFSNSNMKPEQFPTSQDAKGYQNNCAKLMTRSTGFFGAPLGKPMAAGNLFIGRFDENGALTKPLESTEFGEPFPLNPKSITGYYKYKAGNVFKEVNKVIKDKKDIGDIYAIFYETGPDLIRLNGTNQFTHKNIYSIARIGADSDGMIETEEWVKFEIPFVKRPNKILNLSKLKSDKYNLAIVFTSSKDGDKFHGALNSVLYIDQVEIKF